MANNTELCIPYSTTSLYDVIRKNFKTISRRAFLHRMVYIGEYDFCEASELEQQFKNIIDKINGAYCDEKLTGLLITYKSQFCHIIEGSETSLCQHLLCTDSDHLFSKIKRCKLLIQLHHINQRFLRVWTSYSCSPPTTVENIDPKSDLETSMKYVTTCIDKLFTFASAFVKCFDIKKDDDSDDGDTNILTNLPKNVLPENKLLDFLLNCKYLTDIAAISKRMKLQYDADNDADPIWPVGTDFIPYNVFENAELTSIEPIFKFVESLTSLEGSKSRASLSQL